MRELVANRNIGVKSPRCAVLPMDPEQVALEQKRHETALLKAAHSADEEANH